MKELSGKSWKMCSRQGKWNVKRPKDVCKIIVHLKNYKRNFNSDWRPECKMERAKR